MSMDRLIFLADKLQDPVRLTELRLPAQLITHAILKDAKMFKSRSTVNYDDVFIIRDLPYSMAGNKVVYGSIFLCSYWEVYRNVLDAYYGCSLSTLGRNHDRDRHHRIEEKVTTLDFATLDDLVHLNYAEGEDVAVSLYLANPNHPKIWSKICNPINTHQRIKSNIHLGFKKQYEEVGK